ncbi:MAG: hypothetical protein J7J06_02805 [Methanosarcinales archaeon]|nr:hypothetical protein [Methanosarcinales archaeon]
MSYKDVLPPDAEFKGYRHVIKQNIKFETDDVEYILERFYSTSENQVFSSIS